MYEARNFIPRHVMENAVVEKYADKSLRVIWGDIPLGRKIQTPGPRCRPWRHDWELDTYPGVRHDYVDKVCRTCGRRKMIR